MHEKEIYSETVTILKNTLARLHERKTIVQQFVAKTLFKWK